MFEDLRAAFREAVENFNRELKRDQVPDTMDRLLRGMKRELVDTHVLIKELEEQISRARSGADHEAAQVAVCRRREELARSIEDLETAELARTYGEKHERRRIVLEQKRTALQQELDFRRRELEEMTARFEEARTQRAGLTASSGRREARDAITEAGDLFSQLDRMADKIEESRAEADAAEALGDLDLDGGSDFHVELDSRPPEPPDVDAALAELKRRMGRQD